MDKIGINPTMWKMYLKYKKNLNAQDRIEATNIMINILKR